MAHRRQVRRRGRSLSRRFRRQAEGGRSRRGRASGEALDTGGTRAPLLTKVLSDRQIKPTSRLIANGGRNNPVRMRRPHHACPKSDASPAMVRSALLNVMIKAARQAGRMLKRDFGEVEHLQVSLKGPANFVCAADRRAEEILRTELAKARPTYGFLGEEGGRTEGEDKSHTWIVDPLDGTTNFLHGIPHFAISVGLRSEERRVG